VRFKNLSIVVIVAFFSILSSFEPADGGENLGAPAGLAASKPLATFEEQGFLFELIGCTSSSRTVSCNLFVTSLAQDKEIVLSAGQTGGIRRINICISRGVDPAGSEFTATSVNLGNKTNPDNGQLRTELVAEVRTPAKLVFKGVLPQDSKWALLELCGAGKKPFKVQFRGIAF
jgi:hypothetical protein